MKSIVIYFSQTGNTKKVAEAIRDSIKTVIGQCDIVKFKEADVNALVVYDLIGLGCPTFAYEMPLNLRPFIRRMGPLRGKHCFIFNTSGGHPGNTLPSMAGALRRHGLKVIGGFNCDGVDRIPHFTVPWYTDGHPDDVDLKAAADFGKEMVERSQRISRGEKIRLPKFPWIKIGGYQEAHRTIDVNKPRSRGFTFYKMTYDKNKCLYPKCHLCADNCPVDAIDLSVDPVIFRKGCITCLFCEVLCPTGAIDIDPESEELQREVIPARFIRYKYPEFFERAKAELIDNRRTLYRMLVDKVELGNYDKLYREAWNKRPRYVIRDTH